MRVLVSDASILIELAKWSLLEALFKLPFEFAVPDALYEDELIDLGEIDREQLKGLGLRVESLDAEGMAQAVSYQTAQPKLTLHDCLAVTLAIGPTGSGKTIMLSAVAGGVLAEPDAKACILAHRDELTAQNREKFGRVNPGLTTSVFDAKEKSWAGRATFAMVQTLSRDAHLDAMPTLDLLAVDEAHHAASKSYRRVIDRVLSRNPRALIFGATATPARSDGKGLREVFSNVADQITLGELIAVGLLVPPRTFVIDVGAQSALAATLRYCPVLATEPEDRLAAIVDFTFNLGAGRLQTSTLRRRVNQRDWTAAGQELRRWVYEGGKVLPGLVTQREAEVALLL